MGVFSISAAFAHIKLRSFFLWMLLSAAVVYIPLSFLSSFGLLGDSLYTIISDTLVFFIFPILWLIYKTKDHNVQFKSFLDKPEVWNWKLIGIATVMGMIFSSGISTVQFYILSYLAPNFILDMMNAEGIIDNSNTFTVIYSVISACVYAPFMEELVFRGFFLNRLAYKWGVKRAIIVSSVLFGLGHSDIIGAAIFGVIMSLLYIKTKSLLTGMVVHALNNLIVSFIQIGSSDMLQTDGPVKLSDLRSVPELGISIGAVVLSLFWIVPFIRKTWRMAAEKGLPVLQPIYKEELFHPDKGVYSKVLITNHFMAVELPDEIVNQLKLQEEDYVRLEVQGNKAIVTKAEESRPRIS
ncbi:type II CAAX endopeptidase family protein [Ectobacillus panaciterrae]|uniref:type II CAAX endopeptidase family protein n=1 Tax=Ectobacillus panaciterrae TaxID=363872 RepID=UPI000419AFA6|nr:type II CAAX endopeptidase family protein [Ectobacillus panaciterrae]